MSDKKHKILICDDEEGIRESLKLILEGNFDIKLVSNGSDCLELLKKNKEIRLVLLDIKMPKQNGIEITKQIRQISPDTKIIIVTGYACTEIAQEALKAGADDYIPKPFETKKVRNVVTMLLNK